MAVRKCCVDDCKSCSTRKEDKGVTFHKFPKDVTLRDIWMTVAHKHTHTDLPMYVCSRHFCKKDFQAYKDSKYVLRSDAVPSIFPWSTEYSEAEMETVTSTEEPVKDDKNVLSDANDELECVAAIKKYIEVQEKEIKELEASQAIDKNDDHTMDSKVCQTERMSVASTVIDMMITESELELERKKDMRNKILSSGEKNNGCMALSVGSKVEAKDFGDDWYSAEIIEVDYDEMEVLVHYEAVSKKHDEWISVSSPRLRPAGTGTVKPGPSSAESWCSDTTSSTTVNVKEEHKEEKGEEKVHPTFKVGEKCLARWRDNRRFVATIRSILPNGSYEVIFDDGCLWSCKISRLYKLRPGKILTETTSNTSVTSSPQYESDSSSASQYNLNPFQTHLFDPTRDYLGSKSERREMKRKLNIKEIFNIGQKRPKTQKSPKEHTEKTPIDKKPRIIRRKNLKLKKGNKVKTEVKTEIHAANAVASIIGTINQEIPIPNIKEEPISTEDTIQGKPVEMEVDLNDKIPLEIEKDTPIANETSAKEIVAESDKVELEDLKPYLDPEVMEEEVQLEQFEKPDEGTHEEVIDRIKEAINKLEDGLNQEQTISPKPEIKTEIQSDVSEPKVEAMSAPEENLVDVTPKIEQEPIKTEVIKTEKEINKIEKGIKKEKRLNKTTKDEKKHSKIKRVKKIRLLHAKKVKKEVEKVKHELEEMKKQVLEMRRQMSKDGEIKEKPESFLLPGEWCCKWVNGQPVGTVSEIESEMKPDASGVMPLPRRSVQVVDKRLPEGWTKHMVRRSFGHSAGKWDVVLVSPDNRRFHTKNEMRSYLENNPNKELQSYDHVLMDFGVHLKLARKMGWISRTADGMVDGPVNQLPAGTLSSTSPLVKRKSLGLKRKGMKLKNKVPKLTIRMKPKGQAVMQHPEIIPSTSAQSVDESMPSSEANYEQLNTPPLEDGYVYVGSLKVQVIDTLLRCPAEGCLKNFRNNTLLQMHIKHYHRELRKMMGVTPKVLDLAYRRTMPVHAETPRAKDDQKIIKVKIPRPPKPKVEKDEPKPDIKIEKQDMEVDTTPTTPTKETEIPIPRSQDSPKLRQALSNKPIKRPRVLLPVRRPDPEPIIPEELKDELAFETKPPLEPVIEIPPLESLDFETAISTHTVTKPLNEKKRKGEKKKKCFVLPPKGPMSEEEDWFTNTNSDVDTRSSFPRSGTPDSKIDSKVAQVSSESNEETKEANQMYTYNENGERIKIVHMKREEIINCHCGFREEDGLMVQCELCLCWQHALCHNIQREADVPEKYTCSICLKPWRGRRSARFVHEQERLYCGALPGAPPADKHGDSLRRSHELSGNLLRIQDALHALKVKYYVATKKDHPKLYLWAKDWEHAELQYTQEKLNSDYSDLNIMISNIDKENLPIKPDDVKDIPLDIRTSPSEDDHERFSQRDAPLGSQSLLSGLLSSPGAASLDLPISTSELERLAKSVQEAESQRTVIAAPQPEAAIENGACRARLLKHLQRCQALIDARLDSIEAQVAELESQDPSFEDDETADYFPRTKQTIQMMMRDLETMEELAVIT